MTCGYCNDTDYNTSAGERLKVPISGNMSAKSHVKFSFEPIDPGQPSSAILRILASGIDPNVNSCMAGKNCLQVLGTETNSGFRLRNGNSKQLKCLASNGNFALMPQREVEKCGEWLACMPEDQKQQLESLLLASGTRIDSPRAIRQGKRNEQATNPATNEKRNEATVQSGGRQRRRLVLPLDLLASVQSGGRRRRRRDRYHNRDQDEDEEEDEDEDEDDPEIRRIPHAEPQECVDPSVEDPETWDCDCLENMVKICGESNPPCMTNIMCAHPRICESWKTDNCVGSSINASLQERSTREAHGATESRTSQQIAGQRITSLLSDGLDNTVQGKCSQ